MRYIKTFFGILLYLLFSCLALLPVLAIRINIDSAHYAIAVTVWAVVMSLFFLPALAIIIKKVWFFEARGEAIDLERLENILFDINEFNAPVSVQKQRRKIIVTWRHQDQAWCELLEKNKTKKLYELWISFDNSTRTATMTDKYRTVDWSLSPIKLKTGWLALSKPYFRVETGLAWGVENYVDAKPEDYNFSPDEIKSPVLNTIVKNGWNVRFSLL